MKLSQKDIIVLTEGQQIRREIIEKYGSIEQFISKNNIPILSSTIEEYLSKKSITSQKFKCTLVLALDKEYNKIVLSEFEQIERYIDTITENIELYRQKEDLELLEFLKDLCVKKNMPVSTAKMYRAISKYNFHNNNPTAALEQIKFAIDLIKDKNEHNLHIIFLCELALIYFFQSENLKSEKAFKQAEKLVDNSPNINNYSKYVYYSTYSCLLFSTGKSNKARDMLIKAIEFSDTSKKTAQLIINIGATYEKEGECNKSLEYYEKALEYLQEEDLINRGIIFNNISKVYIIKGEYDLALQNSIKAISCFADNQNNPVSISCYLNYFHIKINNTDIANVLDEFIQLIDDLTQKGFYKAINEYLNYFIDVGIKQTDDRIVRRIETYITAAIGKCASEEYKEMLVTHMGNISIYKNQRGSKYGKKKVFINSSTDIPPDIELFVIGKNKDELKESDIIDYKTNSKSRKT